MIAVLLFTFPSLRRRISHGRKNSADPTYLGILCRRIRVPSSAKPVMLRAASAPRGWRWGRGIGVGPRRLTSLQMLRPCTGVRKGCTPSSPRKPQFVVIHSHQPTSRGPIRLTRAYGDGPAPAARLPQTMGTVSALGARVRKQGLNTWPRGTLSGMTWASRNKGTGGDGGMTGQGVCGYTTPQSSFMLTILQPRFGPSSSPCFSCPTCESRS